MRLPLRGGGAGGGRGADGGDGEEAAGEQEATEGGAHEEDVGPRNGAHGRRGRISAYDLGVPPAVELPIAAPAPAPSVAAVTPERYRELAARVRLLSWLSLGAMTVEGAVAIVAGVLASSIALVGFGLDSAVEGFASLIIIWRFTGSRIMSQRAETRAQRLVAIQFFLLAPYVAVESVRALAGGEHPQVSALGMGLAVWSLVTMPLLGIAKQRLAEQIGSAATKGEGAPERPVRLPRRRAAHRPGRQRAGRRLVAGPGRRPVDRRSRGQGGPGRVARRGLLRRLPAGRLSGL